jgi:hypothetical protein
MSATLPKNSSNAVEITNTSDPVKDQSIFSRLASKMPGAANAKTAAFGIMAVVAAAAIDNSGSLKAAAMGASKLPMVGAVMAPMVMIAILLEMEKLNQSLRVFLFKINHVLKQMLNTVKLITEVSMDFKIELNQPALEGITSELAELTELLALYYKVYADSATSGAIAPPSSRLSRFTSSVKSVASTVGSFASRMANKLNTFASVEANKSKALDNIVIANMYFNMLFSQMEFQLKMLSARDHTVYQTTLMNKLNNSDAYKAISSGIIPTAVDDKLNNLIKNLKDDPKVVNAVIVAGAEAVKEEEKEVEAAKDIGVDEIRTPNGTGQDGGAIKRRHIITATNIDPMSEPFIVDHIVRFFQKAQRGQGTERKEVVDISFLHYSKCSRRPSRRTRSKSTKSRANRTFRKFP